MNKNLPILIFFILGIIAYLILMYTEARYFPEIHNRYIALCLGTIPALLISLRYNNKRKIYIILAGVFGGWAATKYSEIYYPLLITIGIIQKI